MNLSQHDHVRECKKFERPFYKCCLRTGPKEGQIEGSRDIVYKRIYVRKFTRKLGSCLLCTGSFKIPVFSLSQLIIRRQFCVYLDCQLLNQADKTRRIFSTIANSLEGRGGLLRCWRIHKLCVLPTSFCHLAARALDPQMESSSVHLNIIAKIKITWSEYLSFC